jgi:hypothetical protein
MTKTKMGAAITARQGDVLVLPEELPPMSKLIEVEPDRGKAIVAYGEATGHHHAFSRAAVTVYRDEADARYVRVAGTARRGDAAKASAINAEIAALFGDLGVSVDARKQAVERVATKAEADGFAALRHLGLDGKQADHKPIVFPAGYTGRILLPSEYAPGEIRRVED